MSDIWSVNGLCRCCHAESSFKSLGVSYTLNGIDQIFSEMLRETFGLDIAPLPGDMGGNTYSICRLCEPRLRDAALFKRQVVECEEKFMRYYTGSGVKDTEYSSKDVKLEADSFTEDLEDQPLSVLRSKNRRKSACLDTHWGEHSDAEDSSTEYSSKGIKLEGPKEENLFPDEKKIKYNDERRSMEIYIEADLEDQPLSVVRSRGRRKSADSASRWAEQSDAEDPNSEKPIKPVKIKKYSCVICPKKFTYNGSLEVHMKIHNGEKTHLCQLCDTKFVHNKDLTKHIEDSHRINGKYSCTICNKSLERASLLKKHLKLHFNDKFKCSYCPKEFQRKKGLKEHLKTHTGERKYTCEVCNKSFGHNQTLKSHMLTHTGERPYVCDVCGRRFPQRTHLKRHIIIIHTGIKPYSCKICNKQFSSKSYLAIHERTHTGERPFSCEVCKKDFTAYTTLKVHMRVHTGLKPYTCSFCSRQFAQMASFKLHERTHTGEKPFSCKVCKKPFSDNGYLKIHMRVHTGEKPYPCEICKRCFRETGQLKRHMRVHTGIKPYTCKICNKQIGNLSKHMRVHSDERPYKCHVCHKQFSISGNLKLHTRQVHHQELE